MLAAVKPQEVPFDVQRPRLAGLEWLGEDPEAVVVIGLMVRETSNTPS